MDAVSSKPVTIAYVKSVLSKRKKDGELEYEQLQALEHAEKFAKLEVKEAEKLVTNIVEKNGKINEETAIKIVDLMPKKRETLNAILLKDKIELSEEENNEILKLLS